MVKKWSPFCGIVKRWGWWRHGGMSGSGTGCWVIVPVPALKTDPVWAWDWALGCRVRSKSLTSCKSDCAALAFFAAFVVRFVVVVVVVVVPSFAPTFFPFFPPATTSDVAGVGKSTVATLGCAMGSS